MLFKIGFSSRPAGMFKAHISIPLARSRRVFSCSRRSLNPIAFRLFNFLTPSCRQAPRLFVVLVVRSVTLGPLSWHAFLTVHSADVRFLISSYRQVPRTVADRSFDVSQRSS